MKTRNMMIDISVPRTTDFIKCWLNLYNVIKYNNHRFIFSGQMKDICPGAVQ